MEHRNRSLDDDTDRVVICSSASYCYFTLSILLFSVGTVITILALDESDGVFSNVTHMWLVGPLFISSGLMVAVKTIMYLRRETMIMFLTRQRTLLREFQYPSLEIACSRSCSNLTRPPSYDTVIGGIQQTSQFATDHDINMNLDERSLNIENPPPTYEEAVLLINQRQNEHIVIT
ncbi:uncharacterized protein CDAR_242981 [Caerostris darwini]|uniref:Uncharacterized protein n=2 Tax=Caerostris TaxID=172845 RepID=A0AAV4SWN2_9ARAC|nr:uncharacterized protein CDAR_242981 [Caerostris darwini]GIZ04886.1 uncharacterized protein CEXT_777481 [Caerostris extrusa]